MDSELFQNLRHLKDFKSLTKNENTYWCYRWPNGKDIEVYDLHTKKTMFTLGHDPHLAQYICDLQNMSNKMIEEVESKYVAV
jgi:hypothetical protein